MEEQKSFRGNLDVSVQAQQAPNMRVMRGKALLDAAALDFKFVENEPRGARSVEVGRTPHSRFVRRPDGLYTVTFRIDPGMRWLGESMVAEMRDIVKVLAADHRRQQREKREKKGGGDGQEKKV